MVLHGFSAAAGKIRGKVRIGGTFVVAIVVAGSAAGGRAVISVRGNGLQVRRGRVARDGVWLLGTGLHRRGEILQGALAMGSGLLETLGGAAAGFVVFVRDGPPRLSQVPAVHRNASFTTTTSISTSKSYTKPSTTS